MPEVITKSSLIRTTTVRAGQRYARSYPLRRQTQRRYHPAMTGGVLGVSPEELQRVSRLITATAGGLATELDALDAEVSKFVGSGWSGGSAGAFTTRWYQWYEGAKLVHQGLAQMGTLMASTGEAFDRNDGVTTANVNAVAEEI